MEIENVTSFQHVLNRITSIKTSVQIATQPILDEVEEEEEKVYI